ncbi:POP1 Ribonucleases P/MRP protein subunit POP1 [Candida maltosa Xu316]
MAPNNSGKKQFNKQKTRLYKSRTIKSQDIDPAYDSKQKILDVSQFVNSRAYEIKSFEQSQLNSKNALASRVFQNLPRILRRRAASHNVKRIPKRLRSRARKEMSSNLPVKKMPRGRRLYKLLLKARLLKVASKIKMMKFDPSDTVFAKSNVRSQFIQLRKEFKKLEGGDEQGDNVGVNELASRPKGNIKYSKRQKEFVWTPTHIWHVKRFHMIKKYGYQMPYSPTQKCFKLMNRWNRSKSVCFDTSYFPSLVMEIPETSDFENMLKKLTNKKVLSKKVLTGQKSYNGWVNWGVKQIAPGFIYVNEDLKTILVRIYPSVYLSLFNQLKEAVAKLDKATIYDCRYALGSIELSGPLSIKSLSKIFHFKNLSSELKDIWYNLSKIKDSDLVPVGTTFTFNLQDPRIWQRPTKNPYKPKQEQDVYDTIIALNSISHVDNSIVSKLLTSEGRYASYENQLSIKQLGKHYSVMESKPSDISHSQIPIILTKIDSQKWLMILPWYWVTPFWIQLTKITDIKPGGTKQLYQFQFENNKPTFPHDYPWLVDGWTHNDLIGEANNIKAGKLPKSQVSVQQAERKITKAFDGNKCEWNSLRNMIHLAHCSGVENLPNQKNRPNFANFDGMNRIIVTRHDVEEMTFQYRDEIVDKADPVVELFDKRNDFHNEFYNRTYSLSDNSPIVRTKLPIVQISLAIAKDGVIEDNARIYVSEDADNIDCIGFVTTGSMNLNVGKYTGIGCIIAQKRILEEPNVKLYVRNPGKSKTYQVEYRVI